MEPSNYYDYGSNNPSQRPQHTQFLDLTNGEGGERQGVSMAYRDDGYVNSTSNVNRSIANSISSLGSTNFSRGGGGDDTTNFMGGKLDPNTPGRLVESGQEHTGRWTKEEHEAFLVALKMYGKEWKKVAAKVKTRTVVQTRTHAQKYFQKLAKANEGKEDVTHVDMGTASEARKSGSSLKKKQRQALSTSNKIPRTASVASAAKVITALSGQQAVPQLTFSRPLEASPGHHGFQAASGIGGGANVVASMASRDRSLYHPTHGFSGAFANSSLSDPRPTSAPSTTINDDAIIGSSAYLHGKHSSIGTSSFPSMKIVAPDHDSAIKQGKFPEPSPAACGKRKLAEIAAARMLAGVAASESLMTQSKSLTSQSNGVNRSTASIPQRGHNPLSNIEDGMATPPPEERDMVTNAAIASKPPEVYKATGTTHAVSSNLSNGPGNIPAGVLRKPMGLSLQIVNPESLGVSEIVKRKNDGQKSPVTPWEGQLQALVR